MSTTTRVTVTFDVDLDPSDRERVDDLRDAVEARLADECGYDENSYPYVPVSGSLVVQAG